MNFNTVMPRLVPDIPIERAWPSPIVRDGRNKPGHDESSATFPREGGA